ncbi:MAG: hypothetical protein JOZ81_19085 [Chloroflexi bacterium]|nr:hypothetical protein [Chloroflexota bacterium]
MTTTSSARMSALETVSTYPLLQSLIHRRSRRFSLGARIPGGALAYTSQRTPVPLTPLEEALLAFSAAGISGLCLGDLPFQPGDLPEGGGGNVLASLAGRVGASADAIHSAALFIINDEGATLFRRPQDVDFGDIAELTTLAAEQRIEELFRRMCVRVSSQRPGVPREVPYVFPFNKWSTNLPGTTYFLPVCDISSMYINVILSAFDEQMGLFFVDERASLQPAGIARFGRSHGGSLHDDPDDQRLFPVLGLETIVLELCMAEQAFMAHNLSLVEQAMGLGGWTHLATATETGWLQALGFRLGSQRLSQILHAGIPQEVVMRVFGKDRELQHGLGLTVDGVDLIKPYCPPYYDTMEDAVLALLDYKRSHAFQVRVAPGQPGAWKDPTAVQADIPPFSDACIEATIAYCTYLYETYGRFPAYFGPARTTLGHQAHHLDLEFYDRFYQPGAYTETQASHMECWHTEAS